MTQKAKHHRSLRNFLLQPLIQVRLGIYSILLALVFSVMVGGLLYLNFFRFYDMVLELTDLREEVTALLADYISNTTWWLGGSIAVYLLTNITLSIVYTHKLVGPTYAFRRHIANLKRGEYASRVVLRRNDAFTEVADDLNTLAEALEEKYGRAKAE
jgi:methyl-accepting chemotaxis protein